MQKCPACWCIPVLCENFENQDIIDCPSRNEIFFVRSERTKILTAQVDFFGRIIYQMSIPLRSERKPLPEGILFLLCEIQHKNF